MQDNYRIHISNWLFFICFLLICMIALGGYTRLSGSGLSIMEWKPVTGIIPPLSHDDWVREFNIYKQIPQYHILNHSFTLEDFKQIFWAEWSHRLLGRLIGIVLLVPLIWFIYKKALSIKLFLWLMFLFVLGGLQGGIGWVMVASGFNQNSIAVAPSLLVAHLSCALILYVLLLWTALSVRYAKTDFTADRSKVTRVRRWVILDCCLLALTIIAGGFTAGTHAGFVYNTFPFMDGHLVPAGYAKLSPFLSNWFQNVAAVQFNHRLLATLTLIMILITVFIGLKSHLQKTAQDAFMLLGWAVLIQYILGLTALLLVVPVWAGTVHQAFAAILLGILVTVLYHLRMPKSVPTEANI